jgi:hypothetical protein
MAVIVVAPRRSRGRCCEELRQPSGGENWEQRGKRKKREAFKSASSLERLNPAITRINEDSFLTEMARRGVVTVGGEEDDLTGGVCLTTRERERGSGVQSSQTLQVWLRVK